MHWPEQGRETIYIGAASVLAVGAGGETEAEFRFFPSDYGRLDQVDDRGKFSVEIAYTDAKGEQPEVTRFDIYKATEGKGPGQSRWQALRSLSGGRVSPSLMRGRNRRTAKPLAVALAPLSALETESPALAGLSFAPRVGLEPTTLRLTAGCSAN